MSKILILNGAQPYPFAKGALNATLAGRARDYLTKHGHKVRVTTVAEGYDVETEVANHEWANTIIMQFPINWMGVPWSFKKYMDEVYMAWMDWLLCVGDGRSAEAPKANYGLGGALKSTNYMLSVTLNAPKEAFGDPAEPFFAGKGVDDLLQPAHLNAKFFGMSPLPTFAAFDVMKNPEIDADLSRFDAHIATVFQGRKDVTT